MKAGSRVTEVRALLRDADRIVRQIDEALSLTILDRVFPLDQCEVDAYHRPPHVFEHSDPEEYVACGCAEEVVQLFSPGYGTMYLGAITNATIETLEAMPTSAVEYYEEEIPTWTPMPQSR